mmetsp:Transcript_18422/g.22413  ORF Transcript_18422/g.22413 Transcript_18422/m.22413 type:complete len:315 (-) Transcript_18422:201-1145(-)
MARDEQFDPVLLGLAQQISRAEGPGIEPLLNTFLGFLRRKTDFFTGATPQAIEEAMVKSVRLQISIAEKEKADKEKKQAEREKKRKEQLAKKEKAPEVMTSALNDNSVEVKVLDDDSQKEAPAKTTQPKTDTDEDEDKDLLTPNSGNGADMEKYSWTQTLNEVSLQVPVPAGIKSKDLDIKISKTKLKVGLKNQDPILSGSLQEDVKVDECTWTLEDASGGRCVGIYLHKVQGTTWWPCVVKGEKLINTKKVEPENSKLSDLDGETRQTVEKMMYDQRQKAMGLPTADEQQKQNVLKKFMEQHPEMDFSQAKFS